MTLAADLSASIGFEQGSFLGDYDPIDTPQGSKIRAAIQEAGSTCTAVGIISQNASLNPKISNCKWAFNGSYGAFASPMYLAARAGIQQNQDSPSRMGVLNVLAGHSGPETALDGRSHFGIFSPNVWDLFPEGQVIRISPWDHNDVAPAYFAAAEIAAREPEVGIIALEAARPDFPVVDRSEFADSDILAAAKGFYTIRDFDPGSRHGTVVVQGASSTVNLIGILPQLEQAGVNVKVVSAISEELFRRQTQRYRDSVLPLEALYDMMVISTGTKRSWPVKNVGPLTEEYSLTADQDNRWLTCGTVDDVIREARLDSDSIFVGVQRFADERDKRLGTQFDLLDTME
jgi:transketolase